jgi:hypothetical protein
MCICAVSELSLDPMYRLGEPLPIVVNQRIYTGTVFGGIRWLCGGIV